jgi:glycosyltransferase involved in cell wall biosynthesis
VTTLCTGARDAVVPEVTGLLVPPGYPDAICEAVLQLLRNPLRRCRMGEVARAWVIQNYVKDRVLGQLVRCYMSLIEQNQSIDTRRVPVPVDSLLNPI